MSDRVLPPDHPQRRALNAEAHARPPEPLRAPERLSYLVLLCEPAEREQALRSLGELAGDHGLEPPEPGVNHWSGDFGRFRLRWEAHTEFVRYSFITPLEGQSPDAADSALESGFARTALEKVPAQWLAALPGRKLVAVHALMLDLAPDAVDLERLSRSCFEGNALVGARLAGGAGVALTDLRLHAGFSRIWVALQGPTPRQAGRLMQRLLEIETYRMLALLAFPVARELAPVTSDSERELAAITAVMAEAGEEQEPLLLDRLTRLAAAMERGTAATHYRFAAAGAYYALVRRRIEELAEIPLPGLQTFQEFTERRLAPAMNTCRAVAERQESLSRRVSRATQLLSTRVAITRERQNQALLASMNRRAKLQLRLQETVEGLSVAAVTYYVVGLVGYLAKGLYGLGVAVDATLAQGLSIPVVAALVALGVRRVRRSVAGAEH